MVAIGGSEGIPEWVKQATDKAIDSKNLDFLIADVKALAPKAVNDSFSFLAIWEFSLIFFNKGFMK